MTRANTGGFTLLELVVVLVIAGLFFALGGPSVRSLYDTMQYREAVRELVSAAKNGSSILSIMLFFGLIGLLIFLVYVFLHLFA